tara:strand:- start:579 stop:761 length:183 start_codon:yes stop_codon:yes gene_type:complete
MTNEDYEKISSAIKNNTTTTHKLVKKDLIWELCFKFKKNNPDFDAERFREKCRLSYGEEL